MLSTTAHRPFGTSYRYPSDLSQQFQLVQTSFKNPSVCSSLISTVLLPRIAIAPASDSSLALDYCARYQVFVCMYA